MPRSIDRNRVRELLDQGAQLVEVLEERQYRAAHLPGAVRVPPRDLTRQRAAQFDRDRPIVLYCYDAM